MPVLLPACTHFITPFLSLSVCLCVCLFVLFLFPPRYYIVLCDSFFHPRIDVYGTVGHRYRCYRRCCRFVRHHVRTVHTHTHIEYNTRYTTIINAMHVHKTEIARCVPVCATQNLRFTDSPQFSSSARHAQMPLRWHIIHAHTLHSRIFACYLNITSVLHFTFYFPFIVVLLLAGSLGVLFEFSSLERSIGVRITVNLHSRDSPALLCSIRACSLSCSLCLSIIPFLARSSSISHFLELYKLFRAHPMHPSERARE